jgi:DNA-binding FadR family transcriptional regulator
MIDENTPVRPHSGRHTEKMAERVAREILRDIEFEGLQPGASLPTERAMLDRLDIGRGSLREALRILEVNGLVTIKTGPGGGPIVAPHDPRHFGQMTALHLQALGVTYRELLDARLEYEALLARRSAQAQTDEGGAMVRAAIDRAVDIDLEDARYAESTSGFHSAVCDAGGDPVLALAAKSIQSLWSRHLSSTIISPAYRQRVHSEHEGIARAIEHHDGERAERLMREHMRFYQDYCETRYPARMDDVVDWN